MSRWAVAVVAVAVLLEACSGGARPAVRASAPAGGPIVYAALGASETAGIGTQDPARESIPQDVYSTLPAGSVLYNFGLPFETTAAALNDELPTAVAVRPALATVWFNVDDLASGVPVADYEARLGQIVAGLTQAGVARVLVANTPHLDRLPAYFACRPDPPAGSRCPLGSVTLPAADQVDAQVQAYNAAIARVVAQNGATLVDLYAAGEVPDLHPDYVSQDGFHPSAAGAAAIAAAFEAALRK